LEDPLYKQKYVVFLPGVLSGRWWHHLGGDTGGHHLGGGNSNISLIFIPNPVDMIQFDKYFSNGMKPTTRKGRAFCGEGQWWWHFGRGGGGMALKFL